VTTLTHKEKLIQTTEIQDKVVSLSTSFDEQTKQAIKNSSKFIRDFLNNNSKTNKVGSYQLKSLTSELLTFWNESISTDTETFWTELRKSNIDFERKEPLRFALTKNRFRNVEQGIGARSFWIELKKLKSITENYSKIEIERIEKIIGDDEKRRLEILKKCLAKKAIPQTQYLKFGECMAYFANCGLFDKYFNKEEVEQLYDNWKSFKSK
jgi:hypothetical protein